MELVPCSLPHQVDKTFTRLLFNSLTRQFPELTSVSMPTSGTGEELTAAGVNLLACVQAHVLAD